MRVSESRARTVRVVVMMLVALCAVSPVVAAPDKADVRVLIDISGSMRQNDPDNLRRPALRMLAGLLQPGTQAGVWTFARWVNNLVPVAEVDASWKKRVISLSEQIASPGQFTNIEEVLDRASRDWTDAPTTHARHLVLLTDGMVDISKAAADNAQSRARIIDTLLPRLKSTGVKVHTIALSEFADHDLMKRLAGDTGGRYQQVAEADELQRVFLRMFETVGTPDAVPLQDNRFVVDSSINEATVLVFSKTDSPPVVLRSPSGETFGDSDLPAGIAWYRDLGYDLITIASPQKGEWSLQADLDPDNRVMIVTDLKLQASDVPAHLAVGERIRVEANLTNRGELVTRPAFLKLLEAHGEAVAAGETRTLALNDRGEEDDGKAGDGRYTMGFGEAVARDEVELLVAFDSPTFMREKRFRVVVHEPVAVQVVDGNDGPELRAEVATAVLTPGATFSAWQETAGQRQPLALNETAPGRWVATLNDSVAPSYLQVRGMSLLGNPIERTLGPLTSPGVEPPPVEPEPVQAPVVEPVAEAVATPPVEPVPVPEPEPEAAPSGWVMPAIMFGAFNLLLLAGGAVWFFLRRRKAGAGGDDLGFDELVEDQADDEDSTGQQVPVQENAA